MKLSLQGVKKRYGSVAVLDGVDLEVPSGGLQVVLGASGAGKSVLLRCFNGLERPDEGTVLVGDRAVETMSEAELVELRLDVGYVFQYSALFDSLSVFENLAWAARAHRGLAGAELRAEAARCLRQVGLDDLVESMEQVAPATLSGGRRKRVAFARALAVAPVVLLHDEPTAGLDPASSRVIGRLIQELNSRAGITSVVVTHDVELALRLAHRIAILSGGRIVFQGTAGELEAGRESGAIRHYLEGTPDSEP